MGCAPCDEGTRKRIRDREGDGKRLPHNACGCRRLAVDVGVPALAGATQAPPEGGTPTQAAFTCEPRQSSAVGMSPIIRPMSTPIAEPRPQPTAAVIGPLPAARVATASPAATQIVRTTTPPKVIFFVP